MTSSNPPSSASPSLPPNDDHRLTSLKNRIMEKLGPEIAYAALDSNLTIQEYSLQLEMVIEPENHPLTGRPVTDLFAEFIGLEEVLEEILAGEIPELALQAVNRPDPMDQDQVRYFDFVVFPADKNKTATGLVLLIREVTDQSRLQQELVQERNSLRLIQRELSQANRRLQHLDQVKTLFLSMAAHDMRTPLAIIGGYLDILEEDLVDVPQHIQKDIRIMQEQLRWIHRLINNALDLNLIEQGLLVVKREPYDLRQGVLEVATMMEYLAAHEKKSLLVDLPLTLPLIWAEPDRIKQIILNLVSNSFKFIQVGGQVELKARALPDRKRVQLRVVDDGPGIPKAYQKHLFKLFYRAPNSGMVQGVGLGLYIVHTLVEQHQGKIWVESEEGAGTTFVIELPYFEPKKQ